MLVTGGFGWFRVVTCGNELLCLVVGMTNMRYALAPLTPCQYAPGPPCTCRVGVMKTAMDDIFMHDQQCLMAMINRSSS